MLSIQHTVLACTFISSYIMLCFKFILYDGIYCTLILFIIYNIYYYDIRHMILLHLFLGIAIHKYRIVIKLLYVRLFIYYNSVYWILLQFVNTKYIICSYHFIGFDFIIEKLFIKKCNKRCFNRCIKKQEKNRINFLV